MRGKMINRAEEYRRELKKAEEREKETAGKKKQIGERDRVRPNAFPFKPPYKPR